MEIKVYKAVPEQLSHGEQYRYGETHQHDTARKPTYQEVNRIHEEKLRSAIHIGPFIISCLHSSAHQSRVHWTKPAWSHGDVLMEKKDYCIGLILDEISH